MQPSSVQFGLFEFHFRTGELRKQGRRIRLEGQPVRVLSKLLERPGELVTREELRNELWPSDTFVNFEHSLNAAVKRLRHALNDSGSNPRFVETLARRGYRFIAPVASAGSPAPQVGPGPQAIDSLAVLPFENSNADPETEYLSDGITESIINSLSQLPAVRVMARSTVFRYKDRGLDPRLVGRKLNVQAVLLGRVLQRGDSLLVATELVEVQNGWQLWGAQYNRRLSDLLAVEEQIAREISEKLRLRLSGEEQSRLTKRYTESTEAYQDYLKGRYHWNRVTGQGLRTGIRYFEQAIQKDPEYALAYAGLADSYGLQGFFGLEPPTEVMPKAKRAALKALEIDDGLAEAHASLAGILKVYDWDWEASEREYKKSLELNPNYATGHRMYAAYLAAMGRHREAEREIGLAQKLDPFSLVISMEVAWNLYMARQYEQAARQAGRTLDLEPRFASAQYALGLAFEQQGRYEDAVAQMQQAQAGSEGHAAVPAGLGHVLAVSGRKDEAREILTRLTESFRGRHLSPYWPALVYAGLGEASAALDWLERAFEDHDVWLVWLGTDPRLDILRSEERFQSLLSRVGLAPRFGSASSGG